MKIETESDRIIVQQAIELIASCEDIQEECESANYHSLLDNLREIGQGLHIHKWDGNRFDYDDGSYEVECSVDGCWNCKYVELLS